jgi:hypothetical protein
MKCVKKTQETADAQETTGHQNASSTFDHSAPRFDAIKSSLIPCAGQSQLYLK